MNGKPVAIVMTLMVLAVYPCVAQKTINANTATVQQVKEWLASGGDPNANPPFALLGSWFMSFAAGNPNTDVIAAIIKAGAKINAPNYGGQTALMLAARSNPNPTVIGALLDAGADAALRDIDGHTAHWYAQTNHNMNGTPELNRLADAASRAAAQSANASTPAASAAGAAKTFQEIVETGTAQEVVEAINKGAKVNEKLDVLGMTPLEAAATRNPHPDVITALLKAGANPKARSRWGGSILAIAVQRITDVDVVNALIKAGTDAAGRNPDLNLALIKAAQVTTSAEVAEALLKSGADPKALDQSDNMTPFRAIQKNRKLLGTPVYWKLAEASGETLMDLAPYASKEVVQLAVDRGANVETRNADGESPLLLASAYNTDPNVISCLLKAGAKIEAQDATGNTPLLLAAGFNPNPAVVSFLLTAGAEVNTPNKKGQTPLTAATPPPGFFGCPPAPRPVNRLDWGKMDALGLINHPVSLEKVNALLKAGADANGRIPLGETDATFLENLSQTSLEPAYLAGVVAAFLKAGAKADGRDSAGATALMAFTFWGGHIRLQILSELLHAGADVNARLTGLPWWERWLQTKTIRAGQTALTLARHPAVVPLLLQAGADINSRDSEGWTPLMIAAKLSLTPDPRAVIVLVFYPEWITALLKAGADVTARNKDGQTAYDIARDNTYLVGKPAYQELEKASKGL